MAGRPLDRGSGSGPPFRPRAARVLLPDPRRRAATRPLQAAALGHLHPLCAISASPSNCWKKPPPLSTSAPSPARTCCTNKAHHHRVLPGDVGSGPKDGVKVRHEPGGCHCRAARPRTGVESRRRCAAVAVRLHATRRGLTARSIPALCEARDKTTQGSDHGHYRWNLAVGAYNGTG
jgi:hypothetical protein